jgi:hypothetical protein
MIAAGAGHEMGKQRLVSDGVCAPGAGGSRRKAKNACAAGPKKSGERGEERGKRRLRDQKSKQKYLKKQNKQQCTMQGTKTGSSTTPQKRFYFLQKAHVKNVFLKIRNQQKPRY